MNKQLLQDEDWDWSLLYYTGTVVLNMTEEEFWKCTPRKLLALLKIHSEIKESKQVSNKVIDKQQAITQFMKW